MRNQELHKVELFTHRGKRIATLYGEDESVLLARAARWQKVLRRLRLTIEHTPPAGLGRAA